MRTDPAESGCHNAEKEKLRRWHDEHQYAVPTLTKKTLETIVNEIMPDAEIRRDYVVRFVWQNYERLCAM